MDTSVGPRTASARETLERVFGFTGFRAGQEEVVARLLEGRSALAIFPTGGGKSLCYQLPALLLDGLTLVISPLIALMKDQLDFLVARGVPAARLDSSLTREATLAVYDGLESGRVKLLYVAPERLNNERFLRRLKQHRLSLLAVDEAHCISEWGHNFRPDYLKIAQAAKDLGVERVLGLTATATPKVASDIAAGFGIDPDDIVQTGFYRPNLTLRVTPCAAEGRRERLLDRLQTRPPGPTIVYVTLQRTAEDVAGFLAGRGYDAHAYHAGMETEERHAVQDTFMKSERGIIVATIAFGMGVDKADIRYVYHYNLPKGLESYAQEIGRAGRDGKPSVCELFACPADTVALENFSYGDTPTPEAVAGMVDEVLQMGSEFDVAVYRLADTYDVRLLVARTLLTYLELEGVLKSVGALYSQYQFQFLRPPGHILAGFNEQRAAFLEAVFAQAGQGRIWYTLDVDRAAQVLGEPRKRLVNAIGYLEEQGDLLVQAGGVRESFRRLRDPDDVEALCARLFQRFQLREDQDIARVAHGLELAQAPTCLTRRLLQYFGEARDDCGHCDRCQAIAPAPLPPLRYPPPTADSLVGLDTLRREHPQALGTARQVARFLCGLTSPATTRARLKTHSLFGVFQEVPFAEVLRLVST